MSWSVVLRWRVCTVTFFVAVLSNLTYRYEELLVSGRASVFAESLPTGATEIDWYFAGWPLKYYAAVCYPERQEFRSFSWPGLLGNVGTWAALLMFLYFYESYSGGEHSRFNWKRRGKPLSATEGQPLSPTPSLRAQEESAELDTMSQNNETTILYRTETGDDGRPDAVPARQKRRLSVGDLLVFTLLVAGSLSYWRLLQSRATADKAYARSVGQSGGNVILRAYAPSMFAPLLPQQLNESLLRVADVTLHTPTTEQVRAALQYAYLESLGIGGGDYDLRSLDELAAKLTLRSLRVAGRTVDSALLTSIGQAKQLQSLNLIRTNATAEGLKNLGEMPALRLAQLTHTDVTITGEQTPGWAKSIRQIYLPRPSSGVAGRHQLVGWPNLATVYCMEYDEGENYQPMELELRDLPQLKELHLDALQLFDLSVDNVPNLESVRKFDYEGQRRIATGLEVAEYPWIRSLSLDGAPSLKELMISGENVSSITLGDVQSLSFAIRVRNMRQVPLETTRAWLDGFKESQGPLKIDFSGLPLAKTDFSWLVQNQNVRQLVLAHSEMDAKQLEQLGSMAGLEELDIIGVPIHGNSMAALIRRMPKLKRLKCEAGHLGRFKLENNETIESIVNRSQFAYGSGLQALHLANLPRLADTFEMDEEAVYLHLESVPSLRGIVFRGVLPAHTHIRGLRDLRVFAAGGDKLDDALVEELLLCSGLQKLTLAHSACSPQILSRLSQLQFLEYLVLTGSIVDDEVVRSWEALPVLKKLRLDKCPVTEASMEHLANFPLLERLFLPPLNRPELRALERFTKLHTLSLAGSKLTQASVSSIVKLKSLTELDLSNCILDNDAMSLLAAECPRSLMRLRLDGATLPGKSFLDLARTHTQLRFSFDNAIVDPRATDFLVENDRIIHEQTLGLPLWFTANNPWLVGEVEDSQETFGEIDPDRYAVTNVHDLVE